MKWRYEVAFQVEVVISVRSDRQDSSPADPKSFNVRSSRVVQGVCFRLQ